MTKTRERRVKFFGPQYDAFVFNTQFGAAVAGVQSGKTFLGAHWAGKKITEFPDKNGIIIAPTYKILQQATLKKFFEIFPELRRYYKEQKGEINLPTGGTVFIRSADNPLGIEGITAHWAWVDEGGMTSVLTWTVVRSRVSMTGGQILITTTPYNMGWLYQDFYLRWLNKQDASLSFFTWRSIDNPYFSQEFYDAEKQRLRSEEFARRYEGRFEKMTGLVYDLPKELEVAPLDVLIKTEARIMGVDWGYRNPASISVLYFRDNEWFIADEWKQAEQTTAEIIQVINNKLTEHKITHVFPDPAEPDRIEECRRAGVPVMATNKDLQGGISFIQQLIREKRFRVCNNCVETLAEMSMYHYPEPEEGKTEKDEPEKFNDHLMDAMRYAIYSFKSSLKVPTKQSQSPVLPYYADRDVPF
ncbi:MAG: terminase family protein [Alphaproteobacteria bacterium]|nr:terminase family protein [Alphaproteobacteria bacterium]